MALNIPLPGVMGDTFGKAIDQGGELFTRMIAPRLKREELAQQKQIHEAQLAQHKQLQQAQMAQQKQLHDAQLAQQWKSHLDNMMISRLTQGRLNRAAEDAHKIALNKLDPDYEVNQIKRLMGLATGGKSASPTEQESYMPSIGGQLGTQQEENDSYMPSIMQPSSMPSINDQLGNEENDSYMPSIGGQEEMPSLPEQPQAMNQAQQQEQIPQLNLNAVSPYKSSRQSTNGGIDMEAIRNSPIVRAVLKKKYGIDFGGAEKETPQEKHDRELQLFKEKRDYELEHPKTGSSSALKETPEEKSQRTYDEFVKKEEYKAAHPKEGAVKEEPALKRANDLKSKLEEAKYKHQLKLEEQKTKENLKNEQTRQKTIESAKNDVPQLEKKMDALKVMEKIAEDKRNDDLFGHWYIGNEKAAQITTNPNAGTWQTYGLAPIIDSEMKMSSRGNQLALKTALANKPNFAEHREVALSKIKSSIAQIQRRIEESKKISGLDENKNEFSHLSDEELKKELAALTGSK